MTKIARGSSLAQTRGPQQHQHQQNNHDHSEHNHRHLLAHIHARYHHGGGGNHDARSHEKQLHGRTPDLEPHVTTVVQTISVIQYIDETRSVIDVKTIRPESSAPRSTRASDLTVDLSFIKSILPTLSIPSLPPPIGVAESTTSSETRTSSVTTPPSSPSVSGALTSTPSTYNASLPTLSSAFNSTSRPLSYSNHTVHSHFLNTTASSRSSDRSSSSRSSTLLTSTTEPPLTVFGGGNAGGAGPTAAYPTSSSTSSDSPPPTDVPTASVVGGVVGGLAGIALIAAILLFLLKWRRNHANGLQLLSDGDGPGRRRSLFSRGGPGGGGVGGGGMTERSIPFAIPASLAALGAGKRASRTQSDAGGSSERGFHRVSGRKLTSVLHSGGDGYSEPSERAVSGSSFYRDSMAMFQDPGNQPLQLGSPMRPESGIMVMRSGPARTPVREQNPFTDDADADRLSPPSLDPLGRSLVSLAGSRASGGSGSRFREDV